MRTNTLDALVLTDEKTLFYDNFEKEHTMGRYVSSSRNWEIVDGNLVNNRLGVDSVKDRIDFYADFPQCVSIEVKVKMKEFWNTDNFILVQLFTKKNYGTRTYGDGYGLLLIRNPEGSGSLRLVRCEKGEITYLGFEYSLPTISLDRWYKLRLESDKSELMAYVDDELAINYPYPFSQLLMRALRTNIHPHKGGIGIIKGAPKIEVDYLRVFTEDTNKITINNLQPGWTVEVMDKDTELVISSKATHASVTLELDDAVDGYIKVINDKGALLTRAPRTHIIGGDIYTYCSICIDDWIQEVENKLFSGTFWREDETKGGIIARVGDPTVFTESTEFAYFYYLHWKYLMEGKDEDFQRIKKMWMLLDWLRESDSSKKHFGLFYERAMIESGQITGIMTRTIVLGTVARFLAHYHLLTGDSRSLDYLVTLLDQMIKIGIVDPDSGELRLYDPVAETLGVKTRDLEKSYLHGYDPASKMQRDIDTNIKNSYIIEAYILGHSLTGNETYLNVATKTADWLINENYDPISKSFPETSTHDTMEFLEAVWNLYLATGDSKYYEVVKDSLLLYFDLRYRGKLIPFRYYSKTDEIYSFDTLTPAQMFLATKLSIWGECEFLEINKHLLAYLYNIRNTKAGDKFDAGSLRYYQRYLSFKIRRWYWGKEVGDKQYLWNFRYSAISNSEVRDEWAPYGNWMSFSLSYLLQNLYSLKYGALISIFPCRYYPGQPYIAFTQAKITEYKATENEVNIHFSASKDSDIRVVMPNWGKPYRMYIDDTLIDTSQKVSHSNQYGTMIPLKIKAGERTLKAKRVS